MQPKSLFLSMPVALGVSSFAAAGLVEDGPEFQVNTYTAGRQGNPRADVSMAPDGSFVAVWTSRHQDGDGYGVFAQRYSATGAPVGGEFLVNTYTTSDQFAPAVSVAADGSFVVVWTSKEFGDDFTEVVGQRFAADGVPLGPYFQVNTHTVLDQRSARVASANDGSFMVVWRTAVPPYGDFDDDIHARRFSASGVPLGPEFQVNTHDESAQGLPHVAMNGDGRAVVVWASPHPLLEEYADGVFGQLFDADGNPTGPEFHVNEFTGSFERPGGIAFTGDGGFVVVWSAQLAGGADAFEVFARRYDASGVPLTGEFRVNSDTEGLQDSPDVIASSAGCFAVAFRGPDFDLGPGIYARRFNAAGSADGPEILVNSYIAGQQQFPLAIAGNDSGNYAVIWESSDGQDGSEEGMFGKRLLATETCAICPMAPLSGCLTGERASLLIKNAEPDSSDQLKWTLSRGEAFAQGDIGDPIVNTRYTLCMYDDRGQGPLLVGELSIVPNSNWIDGDPSGFKYHDPSAYYAGVRKAQLKPGDAGRTKVHIKAKGSRLPTPVPASSANYFVQSPKVIVQLSNNTTGKCWTSEFLTNRKNVPFKFKAKAP